MAGRAPAAEPDRESLKVVLHHVDFDRLGGALPGHLLVSPCRNYGLPPMATAPNHLAGQLLVPLLPELEVLLDIALHHTIRGD